MRGTISSRDFRPAYWPPGEGNRRPMPSSSPGLLRSGRKPNRKNPS